MPDPVGISAPDVIKKVAEMAFGEIMNVPPTQLDPIIDKLELALRLQPSVPGGPPP